MSGRATPLAAELSETGNPWYDYGVRDGYAWKCEGLEYCAEQLELRSRPPRDGQSYLRGNAYGNGWFAGMARAISELVAESPSCSGERPPPGTGAPGGGFGALDKSATHSDMAVWVEGPHGRTFEHTYHAEHGDGAGGVTVRFRPEGALGWPELILFHGLAHAQPGLARRARSG